MTVGDVMKKVERITEVAHFFDTKWVVLVHQQCDRSPIEKLFGEASEFLMEYAESLKSMEIADK